MRYFFSCISIILILLQAGCRKEEPVAEPLVNILSPLPYQTVHLPGILSFEVRVVSKKEIEYVRISVDDRQLQHLFKPQFYYPGEQTVEIEDGIGLGLLPAGSQGPFYFHVAVHDGTSTHHQYTEIDLVNTVSQQVIGFYLLSRPGVNRTQVEYYDLDFSSLLIDEITGDFIDAGVYDQERCLYVTTANQSVLSAYQFDEEGQPGLKWQHFPELPYAEINDLYLDQNMLFAASANGTIDGFDLLTGVKKVSTDIAMDSLPLRIGASAKHIIGDFYSRKAYKNALQSFHRETGYFIGRMDIYFSVLDFYAAADEDSFYLFGNTPSNGLFARYHVPTNATFQLVEFTAGVITGSERLSQNEYIVCTSDQIYRFTIEDGQLTLLKDLPATALDIALDGLTDRLYIVYDQSIVIYAYPSMVILEQHDTDHPLKALRLRRLY